VRIRLPVPIFGDKILEEQKNRRGAWHEVWEVVSDGSHGSSLAANQNLDARLTTVGALAGMGAFVPDAGLLEHHYYRGQNGCVNGRDGPREDDNISRMTTQKPPVKVLRIAQSVMDDERWLDAIKLLKANLPLVRKHWELSWNLAWCYFKVHQLDEGQAHMKRAVALAPKNASSLYGLGRIYLERKEYRKAETSLAQSLQLRDSYAARLALALTYMKQRKFVKAEGVHLEGIRLKRKHVQRYEAYADFLSDVGREREAQTIYGKAKKLRRSVASR